jgi:hypothetical protein
MPSREITPAKERGGVNWRERGAYKFVTGKESAGLDLYRIASFHGVKRTCGIAYSPHHEF